MNIDFKTPEFIAIEKANKDNYKVLEQYIEEVKRLLSEENSENKAYIINALNGILSQAITEIKALRTLRDME